MVFLYAQLKERYKVDIRTIEQQETEFDAELYTNDVHIIAKTFVEI